MLYNCPLSICEWPLVDEIFFNRENLFYYVFQAKWVWKIPQIVFHNFTKRKISITSMIPFYLEKLKSNVQLVGQNNLYGKELILMIQNDSVLNALKLDPDSFTIQSSIFFDLKLISPCYQFRLLTGAIGSKRIWIMIHCSSNEFFVRFVSIISSLRTIIIIIIIIIVEFFFSCSLIKKKKKNSIPKDC